jgi:hypothetical protein
MKKEKTTNTAIRINPSEKKYLEKMASEMGLTFTDLLKEGASFYSSFDSVFWKKIKTFSRNLRIPEYLILQNLAISWMARREAHAEVWGDEADPLLAEFMFTENGPITGEELFASLKKNFVSQFESEKQRVLINKATLLKKKE